MSSIRLPLVARSPLWTIARNSGMVLLVVLFLAMTQWPRATVNLLWNNVIPLLPAVFLINPMIWRNVCPLATLNELTGHRNARPALSTPTLVRFWAVGIVLLFVLVPARRFIFNEHPLPFAVTVLAVGGIALGLGLLVSRRGGFCNTLCPVLPVEKLYGQSPLIAVGSSRCMDCSQCTTAGCIDLAGKRSARQSVKSGQGLSWMLNPFGIFAASFPGFVISYYLTQNTTLTDAGGVYLTVALWTLGSLLLVSTVVGFLRLEANQVLPLLGGAAFGLYYWFGAPGLAAAYHLPPLGAAIIRGAMFGLLAFWLREVFRRSGTVHA